MKAIKDGEEIRIDDGYSHKESIKEIPDRRYDANSKAWYVPCTEKNASLLQMLGAHLCDELAEFVKTTESYDSIDEKPICLMPIRAAPYKHQIRAFNFAMQIFGYTESKGGDANDIQQGK